MLILRVADVAAERGINAKALSEEADISYNTALGLIRGGVSSVSFDVLDRVCAALDAQPGDLLQRVPNEKQEVAP